MLFRPHQHRRCNQNRYKTKMLKCTYLRINTHTSVNEKELHKSFQCLLCTYNEEWAYSFHRLQTGTGHWHVCECSSHLLVFQLLAKQRLHFHVSEPNVDFPKACAIFQQFAYDDRMYSISAHMRSENITLLLLTD